MPTDLPPGWHAGEIVDPQSIYDTSPCVEADGFVSLYGAVESDGGYRLFRVPTSTRVADLIRFFSVGAHGASSYGYDEAETIDKVARVASQITEIVPAKVFFADSAGLKMRFSRPVSEDDLTRIEALFPDDEAMQLGLDGYISEWDGESRLLAQVAEEGIIHLWWD